MDIYRGMDFLTRVCLGSVSFRGLSSALNHGTLQKGRVRPIPIAGVKKTILVASGKGGVGKSTVSVNLACSLQKMSNCKVGLLDEKMSNCKVGLLDADVYGPSIPKMMNVGGQPQVNDNNLIIPPKNHGVKCMSMGLLVGDGAPIVWRGLMVMSAINQLTRKVLWGPLDYLIIDMPPGTGDAQLSICQTVPVDGVVLVSTPQDVAVMDARRGAEMFSKVDTRILGVVENMASHICSQCGHQEAVFGEEGVDRLAADIGLDVLGRIPLCSQVRVSSDQGHPVVVASPHSAISEVYRDIATRVFKDVPIN